ncbi:hypothetical protein [Thermospira aquatica]|uniref:Transposase n=1 Tax=Thermospira aquatica TaxID=2828656 RepID=A0AAX3BF66_9SPIR|nr:hypothetical protein [Thermospira aquatica]URA10910.1 hypothetical protein KDW03_03665 [Thermospira aquatica]
MDPSALAKMYVDAVKNNTISASILTKLPELLTCDWTKVELVGTVYYVSDRTKITYDGVLVRYLGGLYFVKRKIFEVLQKHDKRFRNRLPIVQVV